MSGVVFKSYKLVKELIENTNTENGLTVTANIIDKIYEKGTIIFDAVLGQIKISGASPLA